jgi:predicted RNA-binding Zn ribbon-like protein
VLLVHADAVPQLTHHDGWDWHLHFTRPGTPVADRLAAEGAMALADLLRAGGHDRLRSCIAPGCQAVLVDLSRNRSRRYCDTGNCGNRVHVAAYRARLRQSR